MAMQDPIADMLSRIRNGYKRKILDVPVDHSNIKVGILTVLKEQGYITDFEVTPKGNLRKITITLRYSETGTPALESIDRVSKPSRRIYTPIGGLREYCNGLGAYILNTSKGVMTDKEARKPENHVGGEVICKVF